MALSDELGKLGELHERGVLSDDEFSRAKERVLAQAAASPSHSACASGPTASSPGITIVNGLRRSRSDRWIGGVCGGLAEVSGIASWGWRMIFTLLVLCGGTGLAAYLLLWFFVPDTQAPLVSQRPL